MDYDFDDQGRVVLSVNKTISHNDFAELIAKYLDGFCAVPNCGSEINEGAIVCNNCFEKAKTYREIGPPIAA